MKEAFYVNTSLLPTLFDQFSSTNSFLRTLFSRRGRLLLFTVRLFVQILSKTTLAPAHFCLGSAWEKEL